jgi:nucleotide-binding universal stress UspA family protein
MDRIVLAANADADQPWVADAAADLAQQTGASVSVLSVDELETELLSTLPREERIARAQQAAERAAARLRERGVETSVTVLPGNALEQIRAFADEQQADLIVVGSSTRGRLATRLLGNVPLGLVQQAGRPVMVVTDPVARD